MMKKFYMMALAALVSSAAMAQVSVTFRVDMSDQTVSDNGVHVAGNWQAAAGFTADWQPDLSEMTDDVGFGIYELTVDVPPGTYEFKYINDNNWPGAEQVPLVSQHGGSDNRFFAVTDWHAENGGLTLPAVKFGGSSPEGQVAVRITIDMFLVGDIVDAGVHVAGDFSDPVWTPGLSSAVNMSGSQYAFVANVDPNDTYEYKWLNGNDFITDVSENATGDCAVAGGNRFVDVVEDDVTLPVYCFELCEACTDPTEVVFRVDMNGAGFLSEEGAYIAGTFTNWGAGEQLMTDEGDGIWSYTASLFPSDIQWKFKNGPGGGWEEGITGECQDGGNRIFTVPVSTEPVEVGTFCFQTCEAACDVPDPAPITFRVDMSEETVSPDGVYLISSFFGWQDDPKLMTMTSDNIYEVTLDFAGPENVVYKYVNGTPVAGSPANEEFDGATDPGSCAVTNNNNGWNRVHARSGEPETIIVVPFGSCGTLNTSSADLGMVRVYPNPSNGSTFIEVENPNGYNLRMSVLDITGKVVRDNILLNSGRKEINTSNFAPGLYFLNVTNEKSERSVYKLMVR